ncbi:MAG: SDR family NAD(P)-dependent oxidoreductase [bacterium]
MNILITGASSGIGYELAKRFVDNKENQVFVVARREARLRQLMEETAHSPGKMDYLCFDLEKDDVVRDLLPVVIDHLGKIDVLINNAGLLINKPFEQLVALDFDRIFAVNVKSVFLLVQALLPHFNSSAHIVNMSSMGGVQGSAKFPGLSLYSAAKGAVSILTECLAEELKEKEIRVNALAIGAVQTEMLSQAFPGYKAPLSPSEMAAFVADFAVSGHRYFNGKILPVSVSTP